MTTGQATKLLAGSVALVTGANRGIGKCIALTLAAHGVRVALAGRARAQLQEVCAYVVAQGGEAEVVPLDVSVEADICRGVAATVDRFGRLDMLINNAGLGIFGDVCAATAAEWDRIMAVNARAPFLLCREAIPHLRQQERSFIVNISSVTGNKGYARQALYSASKHALHGFTKALAKEVQEWGIRVHLVAPGGVDTGMVTQSRPDLDRTVLMSTQDVADVVLFLVTRRGKGVIDEIALRREASLPWA